METGPDTSYRPSIYVPPGGRNTQKMDPDKVQVGDPVPPLTRHGDLQLWNRYAAVNYEYAGHHMDDEVGHHEGFEAAIGMGPFITALFHVMLREWAGEDRGRVLKVGMQSRRPWFRKRIMTQAGKVTAIRDEDGERIVSVDLWADDDNGERMVIGQGEVAIAL